MVKQVAMELLNSVHVGVRAMDVNDVRDIDAAHIWHPYAEPGQDVFVVSSAEGVYLTMADGRQLIDGMSSWWSAVHGHGHPRLVAAAKAQIDTMSHVMFGGLTHEPAAQLTKNLMELTGGDYAQVFYSDSGSVAVEVAMKMALQWGRGRGKKADRFLTWRSGYHGDTFATMSVCDPVGGMHAMWGPNVLTQQIFADAPPVRGSSAPERAKYLEHLEGLIDDSIVALLIEPVVQGAGGMRFHDHELLVGVREICDRNDILLIADEIATGFGRTGELFAALAAGITPDIMCVGKALTGGFMSLAATLATPRVAEGMRPKALMHGPTFMANPLACAVAAEATALIAEGAWKEDVPRIEQGLRAGLASAAKLPGVVDVRVLGAIGVIEMAHDVDMEATTVAAVRNGVWLRPFGRLIYAMPPFVCTDDEVARIAQAMVSAAESA